MASILILRVLIRCLPIDNKSSGSVTLSQDSFSFPILDPPVAKRATETHAMPAKTAASSELIFSISTFPVFKQSTSEHASNSKTHFSGLFSAINVYVDPVMPGGNDPACQTIRQEHCDLRTQLEYMRYIPHSAIASSLGSFNNVTAHFSNSSLSSAPTRPAGSYVVTKHQFPTPIRSSLRTKNSLSAQSSPPSAYPVLSYMSGYPSRPALSQSVNITRLPHGNLPLASYH